MNPSTQPHGDLGPLFDETTPVTGDGGGTKIVYLAGNAFAPKDKTERNLCSAVVTNKPFFV